MRRDDHIFSILTGIFALFLITANVPAAWAADQTTGLPNTAMTWLPKEVLTTDVLARITGRGIASDLPAHDLEKIVGPGFISYLTPDEVAQIKSDDILSQEGRLLILGNLVSYTDKENVPYVTPRSALTADLSAATTPETTTAADRGPFAVQVGIFKARGNAVALFKNLKSKQFHQAYIFKTKDNQNRPIYAVRLGDYESIKEPYIDAARYKTQEKLPAVITYTNALNAIRTDTLPTISLSATELAATTGQGFSNFATDMSNDELDKTVGKGIISNLSPEQLEKISASGVLSSEAVRLKTKNLARIIARGITYMVDESKFTPAELAEIKGRGTTISSIGRLPFSVQAGVYQVRENALAMLKDLQNLGYEPYIFQTTNDQGKSLFAVRLGDYETIKSAYAEATHFKRKEHNPAIVTYINSLQAVKPPKSEIKKQTETESAASGKMLLTPGKQYPSEDLNQLYQEMRTLRKEIDQLKAEAEAREKIRLTEAEQTREEEEILEAVGRDYILAEKGTLSFDYSFAYAYNSADLLSQGEDLGFNIQHTADHSLSNVISTSYAWFDNLTVNASIPFDYQYKDIGADSSRDVSDIGDVSFGARWQILKQTEAVPPLILNATISAPTGRSPYDINPDKDLSTGSGTWQLSLGSAVSKTFDPVVVYSSFGLSYVLAQNGLDYNLSNGTTLDKVDSSYGFGLGFGVGYAMSYKATLNASVAYSYALGTTYHYKNGGKMDAGDAASASLSVGMGWKLDSDRTISVGLGMGLTNNTSDFSLSFRIPFDYEL